MEVVQLHIRYIKFYESLFNVGYLDDRFTQLQKLQNASDPRFVIKVLSTYFEDSEKTLSDLNGTMSQHPIDFNKLDYYIHKLKGSSCSIGAQRVANACSAFRSSYLRQNGEACMRCVAQIKQEYAIVKEKLRNLFWLEQQIVRAGGGVLVLHN